MITESMTMRDGAGHSTREQRNDIELAIKNVNVRCSCTPVVSGVGHESLRLRTVDF